MSVRRLSVVRWGLATLVASVGLLVATSAMAQASASASVSTTGTSAKASARAEAAGDSDHDRFIGTFAVGYMGAATVPIANFDPNTGIANNSLSATASTVNAPVIGVRYWLNEMIGIDAGLGIRSVSGSTTRHLFAANTNPQQEGDVTLDKVSQTAFLIHAGVPLALKNEKHFSFQVIPELNVGFSNGTVKDQDRTFPPATNPTTMGDIKLSGTRFDIGGRVGAEIHFGFIGIPQLSLQAGVGLYLSRTTFKAKGGSIPAGQGGYPNGRPDLSHEDKTMDIHTSVAGEPWAIFTNNIAALYYF